MNGQQTIFENMTIHHGRSFTVVAKTMEEAVGIIKTHLAAEAMHIAAGIIKPMGRERLGRYERMECRPLKLAGTFAIDVIL